MHKENIVEIRSVRLLQKDLIEAYISTTQHGRRNYRRYILTKKEFEEAKRSGFI